MNWLKIMMVLSMLCILQGCATILNGTKKSIMVSSSEDDTKVTVLYEEKRITGKNFAMVKAKKGAITAIGEKKGCTTTQKTIESSGDWGWYIAGNLFSWYVFGWIIDPITGGLWYYDETEIDVTPVCLENNEDKWNTPKDSKRFN
ncbi:MULTISPECIES: hypothetical protein [unclassified Fibrobacter]|uniref:hypothetical protein n=1 Tax=unclassified Fibrobacter TaxID=2634177 RepID=UPI000D6AE41A|nr:MULTISPECIES: hypothetical protein [unclassified Fibrobacter]PWJ62735.1 hypothetical protein BGX12_12020 [Fibrobacter sp. UWR4]PZW66837.1 hypothetical protein C8E88_102820 [Fibrobacter sp. UWR1]